MIKVSIVTYLRSSEAITPFFYSLVQYFQKKAILDNVYVFSTNRNKPNLPQNWVIISDEGKTKYKRLKYLVDALPPSMLLSIDNDMTIDCSVVACFLKEFIASGFPIGWGRIGVSNKGLVPGLITIDKILSHSFIRPMLWKCNVGISVPGQCFVLRTEYYSHLPETDTFLDDLQIGLFTCYHAYPVFQSKETLGFEKVQDTFTKLFKQRRRWASGFASTLKTARKISSKSYFLVLMHGFFYHIFFPILILFIFFLFFKNIIPAFITSTLLLIFLCKGNLLLLGSAFFYCIIFPCLHVFWLVTLISSLVRARYDN